ncbi:MAG: 2-phospho-L-lactate guanylyltransferase [Mycobacteriales bacterium]
MPPRWTAVVPVKELSRAKSRLPGPQDRRAALALAMAQDTVTAITGCPDIGRVLVVTDDPTAAAALVSTPRVSVHPDHPGTGLSAAAEHGAALARAAAPADGVVVLAADLPALTSAALGQVLARAGRASRAVVADTAGRGTVLLAAGPGIDLGAAFEGASHSAHTRSGAADLTRGAAAGLRRDVDTVPDLEAAARLGVGPWTARAMTDWQLAPHRGAR